MKVRGSVSPVIRFIYSTLPFSLAKGEVTIRVHSDPLTHPGGCFRATNKIRGVSLDQPSAQ